MNYAEYRSQFQVEIESSEDLEQDEQDIMGIASNEARIDELINSLNDEGVSAEDKSETISTLDAVSVFSPVFNLKMPEYINALRGLLEDKNQELREQVFGTLSVMKDEVAQDRLRQELESNKPEEERLIPTHHAIAMLGHDEKALDFALLRKVAENPPNKESLMAAVRHLGDDKGAVAVLQAIMEDESNPIEIRSMIPGMLSRHSPGAFLDSVRKILAGADAEHELAPFFASSAANLQRGDFGSEFNKVKGVLAGLVKRGSRELREAAEYLFKEDGDGPEMMA